MGLVVNPPPQLRQTPFSLLCTKRQDQQLTEKRDLIFKILCFQVEGFGQFPQKGLDFLNTPSSLFATCCLGGIIASVPKILRSLSWNFNSPVSKGEYFWQHHLLGEVASLDRNNSCSVLLPPSFSFPQLVLSSTCCPLWFIPNPWYLTEVLVFTYSRYLFTLEIILSASDH